MTERPSEIQRLVVKALVCGRDAADFRNPIDRETLIARGMGLINEPNKVTEWEDQQACLARMMRCSKTLYQLCRTELYKECLVADIDAFVQDLTTNPRKMQLLDLVETLRLYQPMRHMLTDPTYTQLMEEEAWNHCGAKEYASGNWVGTILAGENEEFAGRYLFEPACAILRVANAKAMSGNPTRSILPNLSRVIMTGVPETFPWGTFQFDFNFFSEDLAPAPLPLFLLGLPSVEHYCQTSPTGPLALPNEIIWTPNHPDIVTIHPIAMLDGSGPIWLPPIVLHSINRLMFDGNCMVQSESDSGEDLVYEDLEAAFIPLYATLERAILCTGLNGHDWEMRPSFSASPSDAGVELGDTRIELYHYIRQGSREKVTANPDNRGELSSDLTHVQSIFEERLGPWKGKVFVKNREDCPPCLACGFEGHWKNRD